MTKPHDPTPRRRVTPLRLAFGGFAVAALGAVLAFSIDYGPHNPISYVAFGLALLGILMGWAGILWGWSTFGTNFFKRARSK